jgi:PAS domain S-box-containing protein
MLVDPQWFLLITVNKAEVGVLSDVTGPSAKSGRPSKERPNMEEELTAAHRKLAEQADGLARLHDLSTRLENSTELEPMVLSILESIASFHRTDKGSLSLVDEQSGRSQIKASLNFDESILDELKSRPEGLDACSGVFPNHERVIIEDTEIDPLSEPCRELARRAGFRAVHSTPLITRDGRVLGVLSVHFAAPRYPTPFEIQLSDLYARQTADFIEQVRIKRRLRESEHTAREIEARFRSILENSPAVIFIKDTEGRYIQINRSYEQVLHLTAEEIVHKTDFDLFPEAIAKEFRTNDLTVLRSGKPLEIEETALHEDGLRTYISIRFPLLHEDGSIYAVAGISTDITERKRNETVAQRLAAIVESSDDAIVSKDLNGIISSWNKGAERIFGYKAEEVIGKPITILIPPDRLNEEPGILHRIRHGERIDHYETIRRCKDGTLLDVSLTVSPVKDASGKVIGASKVARDITDRVRTKEKLEQTVAARTASLREAIAQMEEFSYSVSHDLRSPVRAMQGYARALSEDFGDRLDENGKEYLDRIIQGSSRMERLIHDVLTYSRVNRIEMKLQRVSLDALVRGVVRQYPEFDARRADIYVQPDLPTVFAHEPSLGQAVANVLSNAVKFVAPGVRPNVIVMAEQQNGKTTLRIKDNGIGIKPEYQHRLFGMFERIHPDEKYEGTGIGLAIVRKTVERMGGRVGVESDGTNGSVFWIELPGAKL